MALNFQVNLLENTSLPISTVSINDGWILLNNNTLRHNSTKTTRTNKIYTNKFIKNFNYKVSITIANYISCGIKIIINNNISETFTSNGIKDFIFVATDLTQNIILESDGFLDITNITIKEISRNREILNYNNSTIFENKSFTVSYDLINNKWLSYHEYLPNNYIKHNTDYLIYDHNAIKKGNSKVKYLKAILEIVSNEYPMTTKVLDSITTNVESYTIDESKINEFFDKLLVYTEMQISGNIELNSTNLTKKEKNWNINKLLDISKYQSNVKLFSKDWENIKNNYFTDKIINTNGIDLTKPWYKLARFRDKYFIIRFIYDNLDNRKIIVNFVNTQYRISQR